MMDLPTRSGPPGARRWEDPQLEWSDHDDEALKALKRRFSDVWSQIERIEPLKLEMRKIIAAIKAYNAEGNDT